MISFFVTTALLAGAPLPVPEYTLDPRDFVPPAAVGRQFLWRRKLIGKYDGQYVSFTGTFNPRAAVTDDNGRYILTLEGDPVDRRATGGIQIAPLRVMVQFGRDDAAEALLKSAKKVRGTAKMKMTIYGTASFATDFRIVNSAVAKVLGYYDKNGKRLDDPKSTKRSPPGRS